MKKVKNLLAIALVLALLTGSISVVSANSDINASSTIGGKFTTYQEPNPVGD